MKTTKQQRQLPEMSLRQTLLQRGGGGGGESEIAGAVDRQLDAKGGNESTRHTILLVDDEPKILKSLKRIFVDDDYQILTAENATIACSLLATRPVSLIISDHHMPGMTGIEFLKKIRTAYPQTIRLMLTGVTDSEVVMAAVNEGAVYKFINKPWHDEDLRVTVRLALAQYDLIRENAKLKRVTRRQSHELNNLRQFAGVDRSTLGSVLISRGLLLPGQLEMVEKYSKQRDVILIKALIELGMVDEQVLIKVIQDESKVDFIDFKDLVLDRELSGVLPREMCESGSLVPLHCDDKSLSLAMADPLDLARIDAVGFATKKNIVPRLACSADIAKAISYLYEGTLMEDAAAGDHLDYAAAHNDIDVVLDEDEVETVEQLMAKSATPSAVHIVNTIFAEAIKRSASDIHIEPRVTHTLVRYRIDGLLHSRIKIPAERHLATISRLKILAKMDIAERRIPQDGRITVRSAEKFVDLRVSSMPTIHGEKMVCRLLDKSESVWALDELGIRGQSLARLRNTINIPQGMVIATGPTGSGKTTSLYSMMKERLSSTLNYVTIEDPVEYILDSAAQVHIHEKIGLTFASTLRCTLRQDPDVILVGEIRDLETAMAAFQAAMTGHLVFTTLHTNSTVGTISRLFHLGVAPYLVASAVQGIIAQRLVRRNCPHCTELKDYDQSLPKTLGLGDNNWPAQLSYGVGCEQCHGTGYLGRLGLYEVFQMNQEFRQFLTSNYRESELSQMAQSIGMETLIEDGKQKIIDGLTTLEELLRILGPAIKYDYSCRQCQASLDLKYSTCPYCGTVQRRVCKNCQVGLEAEWVACPFCGDKNTV